MTASLFFERKPAASYSTTPAKCDTAKRGASEEEEERVGRRVGRAGLVRHAELLSVSKRRLT